MVRTEFDGLYLELSCHLWDCLPGCRRANILTWKLTKAVAKLQHAAPLFVGTPYAKSWSCESLGSQALCAHPASTALLQSTHILHSLCHRARKTAQRASCQIGKNYNKVATKTLCVLKTLH